jgi:hypothetical protein
MVQFSTELDRAAAVTYSAASPPVGLARRANADLQIGRGQPGAFRLDGLFPDHASPWDESNQSFEGHAVCFDLFEKRTQQTVLMLTT